MWLLNAVAFTAIVSAISLFGLMIAINSRPIQGEFNRLLVLSSKYDEAFQLLSKIIELENPFRRKPRPEGDGRGFRLGRRVRHGRYCAWTVCSSREDANG